MAATYCRIVTSATLAAAMIVAICGCNEHEQLHKLTQPETNRQIELIAEIHRKDVNGRHLIGRDVTDFPELFSLADETSTNGNVETFVFLRRGAGGNDDGTDASVSCDVEDGKILLFSYNISFN